MTKKIKSCTLVLSAPRAIIQAISTKVQNLGGGVYVKKFFDNMYYGKLKPVILGIWGYLSTQRGRGRGRIDINTCFSFLFFYINID